MDPTRKILAAMTLTLTISIGPAADAPAWIGYGGPEGSRVFTDVKPPTVFSGADITWKVALPDKGWGNSSPVVVGDRIFLLCEFDESVNEYPSLVCMSAKDGSVLWKALLDHTPLLANGAQVKAAWTALLDDLRLRAEVNAILAKHGKTPEIEAKAKGKGYSINHKNQIRREDSNSLKAEKDIAASGGLMLESWREGRASGGDSDCVGHAYATPVTDGERVYVQTAFGGFFCFDLSGKRLWSTVSIGQLGEYCRNGRSPILYKSLMLSDITNKVRAFDKLSGKLLWSDDTPMKRGKQGVDTIVSPAILTVNGVDILWAAGCHAYRLPEGKQLTVEGWSEHGMQTLVKKDERDVIFFCGAGEHCGWSGKGNGGKGPSAPAAVRFTLEDETLKGTVLWHGGQLAPRWNERIGGSNLPWMTYHQGKLHHITGPILDALTGKIVTGAFTDQPQGGGRAVPPTGHLLLIANGHIFGFGGAPGQGNRNAAMISVYTTDGKSVSDNIIPELTSYGWTFTFDQDSIYVRGLRHLVKIQGRK